MRKKISYILVFAGFLLIIYELIRFFQDSWDGSTILAAIGLGLTSVGLLFYPRKSK